MYDINSLNDEERQLVLHLGDLVTLSQKYHKPYFSDFLNERQTSLAVDTMKKNGITDYVLWGGFEGASRVMLCVFPPYMCPEREDFPLVCLSVRYRNTDVLTHRDFLGSLMSLGIKREVVGDIAVQEGLASFFVKADFETYITSQITKIGRVGITFTDRTVDFEKLAQDYEECECVVSSLRIDNVVAAAAKLSREKAKQAVKSGFVAVNYETMYDTDSKVLSGDKVSVRGYGKFIVLFDGSVSRKGKYRILLRKFR